jgi:hypothetical protein
LEELYKLGYVHRSVCPEKVLITHEPLEVHLAGYSTATLASTMLRTQIPRPSIYSDDWKHLNDGSQAHDVFSVAMLIFRYECQHKDWQNAYTLKEVGRLVD